MSTSPPDAAFAPTDAEVDAFERDGAFVPRLPRAEVETLRAGVERNSPTSARSA